MIERWKVTGSRGAWRVTDEDFIQKGWGFGLKPDAVRLAKQLNIYAANVELYYRLYTKECDESQAQYMELLELRDEVRHLI